MRDFNLLCMGCMKIKSDKGECPYCHFDLEKYQDEKEKKGLHYLQPGSILNGRYMIGKVLGEGGFGITYIGWNLNLETPIAVKEYFPNGFVTRNANETDTVSVLSGEGKEKFYFKQKDRFLDEAKTLGRLENIDAIVSVKDCFAENGTAYIVMEYLEGEDFGSYLRRNGGKIPANQVFEMVEPIIKALAFVHKNNNGLIHRDISPDNIRITKNSKIKLMDFGAARETEEEKSLSVVLKPGYAPEEQYRTRGKQGPWTDVYGLCATMYRAIVGKKPIESLERIVEDHLKTPSELGISINSMQEKALMKGLAVLAKNRWQSMDELYNAIYGSQITNMRTQEVKTSQLSNTRMQEVKIPQLSNTRMQEAKTPQLSNVRIREAENRDLKSSVKQQNMQERPMVVAINAGYESAWNPQSRKKSSIAGTYSYVSEYRVNLSVALKLQEELERRGYRVIMTRRNNENIIDCSRRIKMAIDKGAEIIISLHTRRSSSNALSGAWTIIPKKNMDSTYSINKYNDQYHEQSEALAEMVLAGYCEVTEFTNYGSLEWDLVETKCEPIPAIILDMGYMSNEHDDLYMIYEKNQKIMAKGIADGIDGYRFWRKTPLESSIQNAARNTTRNTTQNATQNPIQNPLQSSIQTLPETLPESSAKEEKQILSEKEAIKKELALEEQVLRKKQEEKIILQRKENGRLYGRNRKRK